MNPYIQLGLAALDGIVSLIKALKTQHGMTDEQVVAHAEAQDLQNKEDIKKLLAS